MTEGELPVSIWQGSFTIFGVEVRCHVLSTGERVIEVESIDAFLVASNTEIDPGEMESFARWQAGLDD